MKRFNIGLSGSGGQGLIFAGVLLAGAAVRDGMNVTLSSSYGPEARGGASRSSLVISDEPIDFPLTDRLDVLLALNQESCDMYVPELKDEGLLIVDSSQVIHQPPIRHFSVPFTTIAAEIGAVVTANVVALGTIIELTDIVRPSSLKQVLKERLREDLLPINEKAFKKGMNEGLILKNNYIEYYNY